MTDAQVIVALLFLPLLVTFALAMTWLGWKFEDFIDRWRQ